MTPLLVNHKTDNQNYEIQSILSLLYSSLWSCVGFIRYFFPIFSLIPTF